MLVLIFLLNLHYTCFLPSPFMTNNSTVPTGFFKWFGLYFKMIILLLAFYFCASNLLLQSVLLAHSGYLVSRSQSRCDWSTHFFCIRVPEVKNHSKPLTPPIKLMTVIKTNWGIICKADISNGDQVMSDALCFQRHPHTRTNNEYMHVYM